MLHWIDVALCELLLFACFGLLIGGLDDFAVDTVWIVRNWVRRNSVERSYPPATMLTLAPPARPGRIAVIIGAWDESQVIGQMLRAALARFDHDDYRIYVGTYRNDPATVRAVAEVANVDDRIRQVVGQIDGPTTKGENLNRIWRYILADEAICGVRYKAIVLHDAEDVVHPFELRLFDRMIERVDVVQLPVLPLTHPKSRWIAGHYCDEFAEAHHRQLVVRETLGAGVPLAGVGCAISRRAMVHLARLGDGCPFDPGSLTEDYELGLRLAELGYRGIFMLLPEDNGAQPVAVRALFPMRINDAVRQKRRWIAGIALAGWDRLGWTGHLSERWMRLRDRRAPIAAVVLSAAYVALLLWGISSGWHALAGTYRAAPNHLLGTLLWVNGLLLLWRAQMRWRSVRAFYGVAEAWWEIPRIAVSNAIAMMAAVRATLLYIRHMNGRPLHWDKTAHDFPDELPGR